MLPLHGEQFHFTAVADAIAAVGEYDIAAEKAEKLFVRFEIQITYSNADAIVATFKQKTMPSHS